MIKHCNCISLRQSSYDSSLHTAFCPGSIPQQLQWLESECDSFLTEHTQMGDSVAVTEEFKTQYETFLETIEVNLNQECIVGPFSNVLRYPHFRREVL